MLPVPTFPAAGLPRFHGALRAAAQALPARLRRAIERWQERRFEYAACRTLRELDDRTLHDLGLDRCEIWPAMFHDDSRRSGFAAPAREAVPSDKVARDHLAEPGMSTSFRPIRSTVRIAAGFGAVVVALGLAGAQLGLADHYASQTEPSALAASSSARLAAAQTQDNRVAR